MPNWDYIIEGGGHEAWGTKPTDPVTPKVGYGGHPLQTRPKRKTLTVYQGRQSFSIEVPMILWRDGASIEEDRIGLENMATTKGEVSSAGQPEQPPRVTIKSKYALPIPPVLGHQNEIEWFIEDLQWDATEFRNPPEEGGYLTYKLVTVTLLESTPEILLERGAISAGTPRGKYRVQKGDTFKKIAAKFKTSVSAIKRLNPKVRSDGALKKLVGKFITVPEAPKAKPHKKVVTKSRSKAKRKR